MFSLKNFLFPSISFEIKSQKSPEEIALILKEETSSDSFGENSFYGTVSPSEFKLTQNPPRFVRNSFTPVILGKISQEYGKTTVSIQMRMALPVQIFCFIWQLPLPFVSLLGILFSVTEGISVGLPFFLLPIVFIAFLNLLIYVGFHIPAKSTKQWLETWLS